VDLTQSLVFGLRSRTSPRMGSIIDRHMIHGESVGRNHEDKVRGMLKVADG